MRLIDAGALRKNMEFVCMGVMAGSDSFNAPLLEIDNAPTINPEPHWIPTSERLPKISEDVLLSYFDEVTIGWLNSDGSWSIFDGQECVSADEISAWMPLPEPWKGE